MITIEALKKAGLKDRIPLVRGVIQDIYAHYKDNQKLVVRDSTGTVNVKVWGPNPLPSSWKLREVEIQNAEWNEALYKGQTTQYLSVSGPARIELVSKGIDFKTLGQKMEQNRQEQKLVNAMCDIVTGKPFNSTPSNATAPPASDSAPTRVNTPSAPQSVPTAKPINGNGNGDKDVKLALNRLANLYLHCLEAAGYVRSNWETRHQSKMTDDQFQACASSLYIQATRMVLDNKVQSGQFNG